MSSAARLAVIRLKAITEQIADEMGKASTDQGDMEDRLAGIFARYFARLAEIVRARAWGTAPNAFTREMLQDDAFRAELTLALIDAARNGLDVAQVPGAIQLDGAATNAAAARWAAQYVGELIKDIDQTTLDGVRAAVQTFAETPGMTLNDLMTLMPFGRERAMMIAVTETTRAYAQAQQVYGDTLKEKFPDVRVVKKWNTNNDEKVCPVCGPADGQEIDLNESFKNGLDKPPAHPNCRCWMTVRTRI